MINMVLLVTHAISIYESTKLYKRIRRPEEQPTDRVRIIDEAIVEYMNIQTRLKSKMNLEAVISKDLADCTEIGKALADVCRQMRVVSDKLDVYQRVMAWSLR